MAGSGQLTDVEQEIKSLPACDCTAELPIALIRAIVELMKMVHKLQQCV